MNASALLAAQGWRGEGHSLHASDDAIGLSKPLLLNRKQNSLGLGTKHFTSDQWWLSAFDEQVKGLDTSQEGRVVQTVKAGKLSTVGKGTGRYALYASFVKGGLLEGSIPKDTDGDESTSKEDEDREERPQTGESTPTSDSRDAMEAGETKEERRARREARREARRIRKEAKLVQQAGEVKAPFADGVSKVETKEERRARKEARRKQKHEEKHKQRRKSTDR